ncbi:polysaccharide lyase [Stigmatella aurantiaca]|nr:polysaccharide lyase [Stigmatella aurantiaca]
MKRFLLLVPALLMPALASAATLWKGDFETGNHSQWSRLQSVASDRLQVVTDVVREGRYALKVTVKKGDDPINASGNRNELLYLSHETTNTDYFYKWSTLFPKNYPSADKWQVFAQWHQNGCCGSPPLEFYVVGEEMRLRVGGSSGRIVWKAPLKREVWNDFVMHVKWSSDAKVGFVELYKDGKLVLPKTMAATQFGKEKNYLKLGLYRDESISPTATLYHDGFVMGTTLADVMPPPPAPVPVPEEAPAPVPETPSETEAELPNPSPLPDPGVGTPSAPSAPGYTTLPGDPGDDREDLEFGAPQGCGASATGGLPAMAAVGLIAAALLLRRRPVPVRVRARRR